MPKANDNTVTSSRPSRRQVLAYSALAAAGATFAPLFGRVARADDVGPRKKVLFFTKSQGFQHSVITRTNDDPSVLSYAETILKDFGDKNGFDVTCSKDGTLFSSGKFAEFDVIAFCTTGDLTKDSDKIPMKKDADGKSIPDPDKQPHKEPGMGDDGKAAFLAAIKAGKGFIGFHCAADTFHSKGYAHGKPGVPVNFLRDINEKGEDDFDPYIEMLGGEFIIHGAQQKATLKTIDPKFPGAAALDDTKFPEEWYSLKNFQKDLHVIIAQDCTGMTGPMYERPPYPETWAHMYGKGRVFYTSMGHREDVWKREDFLGLVKGALDWTSGKVEADITPNFETATPGGNVPTAK